MKFEIRNGIVFVNNIRAKKIYTGSARSCFIYKKIIIKVSDCNQDFYRQSNHELDVWKYIEKSDRRFFQCIIAGKKNKNGGWVAQRLIKFKRGRRPLSAWRKVASIAHKYKILNDCIDRNVFWCSINWGVRKNGIPVIYDWGY